VILYYTGAALVLIGYLLAGRGGLRLVRAPLAWRHFSAILGVAGLSALGTVQANLTVTLVTGAVGLFGTRALAGYGIASRLDYLLIPLLFGLGTAVVTMVGTAVGAGQAARARRVAWAGAGIGAGVTGLIGLFAFVFPDAWPSLFSDDPEVRATAALYLRIVAPLYPAFGAGMMLYFASQGANRVLVPVLAGAVRLALAGSVGWLAAAYLAIPLAALFVIVAVALALFALICVAAVRSRNWGKI
jgi:Na+-driven multidrug efflux pump